MLVCCVPHRNATNEIRWPQVPATLFLPSSLCVIVPPWCGSKQQRLGRVDWIDRSARPNESYFTSWWSHGTRICMAFCFETNVAPMRNLVCLDVLAAESRLVTGPLYAFTQTNVICSCVWHMVMCMLELCGVYQHNRRELGHYIRTPKTRIYIYICPCMLHIGDDAVVLFCPTGTTIIEN